MWTGTPLFPEAASTIASRVDALYFFLLGVAIFFSRRSMTTTNAPSARTVDAPAMRSVRMIAAP